MALRAFAGLAALSALIACGGSATVDPGVGASSGGGSGGRGSGGDAATAGGAGGVMLVGGGGSGGDPGLPLDACDAPPEEATTGVKVHHNHLGFEVGRMKSAVIETAATLSRFHLLDEAGAIVYCGELSRPLEGFTDWRGGPLYYVARFDGFDAPGTYRLVVNGSEGEPFEIGEDLLLRTTAPAVLEYFQNSRADDPDVLAADAAVRVIGRASSETVDVRGGWYDASGDISKYLSHLHYANTLNPQQTPLVVWALQNAAEHTAGRLSDELRAGFAAEARWGADFLVRMQDPAGYFYTNVFDQWTGELTNRRVCAFEGQGGTRTADYQAGWREGGGMAIAALARVAAAGASGEFPAARYREVAETAYWHLVDNGAAYADDGQLNLIDWYTALMAATELYGLTGDERYADEAERWADLVMNGTRLDSFRINGAPFWHASDQGLPTLALMRYAATVDGSAPLLPARRVVTDQIYRDFDVAVALVDRPVRFAATNPYGYPQLVVAGDDEDRTQFFIPHDNASGYWWQGENARLASQAAAAALVDQSGAIIAGSEDAFFVLDVSASAISNLDWILGKNPYDISFLEGFGRNNPPPYCGDKPQHGTLRGGIANGITGAGQDGSSIRWMADPGAECWQNWRWTEQWLPHAAWYLIALTELNGSAPDGP